jgi:hypothetical protein
MNGMIHHLPTADVPWQDAPFNGRYDHSAPFSMMLMIADLIDPHPSTTDYMSRTEFGSVATYAAFMGAGWADVYAGRFAR